MALIILLFPTHLLPKTTENKPEIKDSYLWDLVKKKKKSLFPYGLLFFFTCSVKGEITVLNLFCLWKHHHLTVASALTILQTPPGAPRRLCLGSNATHTQLPFGIRPHLLAYLFDSQIYAHVCRVSRHLLPRVTGEGYWVLRPGCLSSQALSSHSHLQVHRGGGWCQRWGFSR